MSAFDVYEADKDTENLVDSLYRILEKSKAMGLHLHSMTASSFFNPQPWRNNQMTPQPNAYISKWEDRTPQQPYGPIFHSTERPQGATGSRRRQQTRGMSLSGHQMSDFHRTTVHNVPLIQNYFSSGEEEQQNNSRYVRGYQQQQHHQSKRRFAGESDEFARDDQVQLRNKKHEQKKKSKAKRRKSSSSSDSDSSSSQESEDSYEKAKEEKRRKKKEKKAAKKKKEAEKKKKKKKKQREPSSSSSDSSASSESEKPKKKAKKEKKEKPKKEKKEEKIDYSQIIFDEEIDSALRNENYGMLLSLIKNPSEELTQFFKTYLEDKNSEFLVTSLETLTEEALQKLFRERFPEDMIDDLARIRSMRKEDVLTVFKAFRKDQNDKELISGLSRAIKRYRQDEKDQKQPAISLTANPIKRRASTTKKEVNSAKRLSQKDRLESVLPALLVPAEFSAKQLDFFKDEFEKQNSELF